MPKGSEQGVAVQKYLVCNKLDPGSTLTSIISTLSHHLHKMTLFKFLLLHLLFSTLHFHINNDTTVLLGLQLSLTSPKFTRHDIRCMKNTHADATRNKQLHNIARDNNLSLCLVLLPVSKYPSVFEGCCLS